MHKGYVKGSGKGASEKFKNGSTLRTLEEVQKFDSYGGVISDDSIMVDIDDMNQADILMDIIEDKQLDCQVYQTTHGMHFMWKNSNKNLKCKTGTKLACGLKADIKTAGNYHALKVDGEIREIIWDTENGHYDELPKWLLPVSSKVDFFNMEEGEGRDSSLFSYILNLTSNGFSKEESRECIEIINKYILKDSLSKDDIERITRDEAFPEYTFFDGKKFLHDKFSEYLKNQYHIKTINGRICVYYDGVYISDYKLLEKLMLRAYPRIKAQMRSEVIKFLEVNLHNLVEANETDEHLIAFKNGVFDLRTNELIDFSPEYNITNKIPFDYNPVAKSELVDKCFNNWSCGDRQIRSLLEECAGYCFYRKNDYETAFILTGAGANGKSTYLETLAYMLGSSNVSNLDLYELDDRFSKVLISGKLANIGDDISDEFIGGKTASIFKKIVSSNSILGEYKGMDGFFFKPYATLLFSANKVPNFKSKGIKAIKRRLKIIPFNATFTKEDIDSGLKWKLRDKEAIEYFIFLAVEGLKRVIDNNGFTESMNVEAEIKKFEIENNPILSWLEEIMIDGDSEDAKHYLTTTPVTEMYQSYEIYCRKSGYTETTVNEFSKQLQSAYNLTSKRRTIKSHKYTFLCTG